MNKREKGQKGAIGKEAGPLQASQGCQGKGLRQKEKQSIGRRQEVCEDEQKG